ncbi:50S ribosomal protein L18 [Tepiditoga spiralis]|uniref:Large ribosomal subunit protein uL18 n=1 Tax=Tepiditoga spiralis TaxID=2108365 RepID=A0A7G1G9Y1_9BACT|nr:50S ribosomal protein L18 [Tepiditoga spiralis]BBE30912.1 50S ribosomal protein L18 [Tepiditoga spiralis]
MIKKVDRDAKRRKRHLRIRRKLSGTSERPRLVVFRSEKHMYAQLVDDEAGKVITSASTIDKDVKIEKTWNVEAAKEIGKLIAEKAKAKGVTKVKFDRGGYQYHGRVKAVAEAAREAGLEL